MIDLVIKLFRSPQVKALVVGLVVGMGSAFLISYRGTNDFEWKLVDGMNLGVQYRATWGQSLPGSPGVIRRFGVPIWDSAQSLGFRLPTLISQYSQSPFVFLTKFAPVENIAILQLFFTMTISLILINLTVVSVGTRDISTRLFFLDISLMGVVVLHSVLNDFFFHVWQFFGLALIFCALYLANLVDIKVTSLQKSIIRASSIFGLSFVLIGHPSWWIMGLVLIVVMMPNLRVITSKLGLASTLVCLGLSGILVLPNTFELLVQEWPARTEGYQTQTSVFDFFQDTWVYRFQPVLAFVAAGFQPILRLINEAGSRTDFFNLVALLLLLFWRFLIRTSDSPDDQGFRKSLRAVFVFLMLMMFGGVVIRSNTAGIGFVFSTHGWQLAHPVLMIVSILFCIKFFQISDLLHNKTILISIVGRIVLFVPVVLGVMHPLIMFEKGVSNSTFSVFRDQPLNLRSATTILDLGFTRLERQTILRGKIKEELLLPIDGHVSSIRHGAYLARAGYPSIATVTKARSVLTLNSPRYRFQSSSVTTLENCDPHVFDFLGLSTVVVGNSMDDQDVNCVKRLQDYFGRDLEIDSLQHKFTNLSYVVYLKSFHSFSIRSTSNNQTTEPCQILERDCLSGFMKTRLTNNRGTPFKLCESVCVFRYKWAISEDYKYLILPANFDHALVVRDLQTGSRLPSQNYQGLIAVSVEGLGNQGEVEVLLEPDFLMWVRVLTTYIHSIVILATLVMMIRSGFIEVRRILNEGAQISGKLESQV